MNGECGLIIHFCVVCAKMMSFVHIVFFYLFCCGIDKASRVIPHTANVSLEGTIMMKKIFLLVLISACSTNKNTGYTDVAPVQIENTGNDINLPEESTSDIRQTSPSEMHESEQSTATEEISKIESQTEMTQILEIYEGEYTGNTINDPNYDGLEIQKNEDDTYEIQVKIPFLTKLYECTGYQSENIILFSTSEWGTDKKVEGSS